MTPERIADNRSRVVWLHANGMEATANALTQCLDEIERLQKELDLIKQHGTAWKESSGTVEFIELNHGVVPPNDFRTYG